MQPRIAYALTAAVFLFSSACICSRAQPIADALPDGQYAIAMSFEDDTEMFIGSLSWMPNGEGAVFEPMDPAQPKISFSFTDVHSDKRYFLTGHATRAIKQSGQGLETRYTGETLVLTADLYIYPQTANTFRLKRNVSVRIGYESLSSGGWTIRRIAPVEQTSGADSAARSSTD